jgi:hypothetical protein
MVSSCNLYVGALRVVASSVSHTHHKRFKPAMAVGKALRWNADVWQVKMEGSATQWGVQALASRRALLLSDFAALAVGGYLLASNRKASHKVRYSDTSTEQLWTIV